MKKFDGLFNLPFPDFETSVQLVFERWMALFRQVPPDAVDMYHGDPFVPPPSCVAEVLRSLADRVVVSSADLPLGVQTPDALMMHHYRAPELTSEKLIQHLRSDFARDGIPAEEVFVGVGVTQLMVAAANRLACYGPVLVPLPSYSPFWIASKVNGSNLVLLRGDKNNDFRITADIIEEGLKAYPHARGLVLIDPVNPTGEVIPREEKQKIANLVDKYPDLVVLEDQIYRHLILDADQPFTSFASLDVQGRSMHQRTFTFRGLSKSYGLPKLRVGFVEGSKSLRKAVGFRDIIWYSTLAPSELGQEIAASVLSQTNDEYLSIVRAQYCDLRDLVLKRVEGINALLQSSNLQDGGHRKILPTVPESGFFMVLKFLGFEDANLGDRNQLVNDHQLGQHILEHGVGLVPASALGYPEDEFRVRITFSSPPEILERGMDRIQTATLALVSSDLQGS